LGNDGGTRRQNDNGREARFDAGLCNAGRDVSAEDVSPYAAEQAKHPNFQLSDQGKLIRLPSEIESEIFTYAMIRDSALVSAGLGGICCVYSVMRMRKRMEEVP
jgi:hypothetical protein